MLKRMKKLLAGTAAVALTAGAAYAADLPSRRAPAPYVAVPVFTWTGFYVGVNAGYGFNDNNNNGTFGNFNFANGAVVPVPGGGFAPVIAPAAAGIFGGNNRQNDGFVGGGQVGYNYQFGAGSGFVVGIEGDIQYTDFNNGRNNGFNGFGNGEFTAGVTPNAAGLGIAAANPGRGNVFLFGNGINSLNNQRGGDFYGTVRGRIGYAFDRVLVYATGGVAFFDDGGRNNNNFFAVGPGAGFFTAAGVGPGGLVTGTFGNRRDDIGYVVGGGVEYAFTNSITARVEGFYIERDSGRRLNGAPVIGVSNTGAPVTTANFGGFGNRNNDSFGVVRAGLNYKFNLF